MKTGITGGLLTIAPDIILFEVAIERFLPLIDYIPLLSRTPNLIKKSLTYVLGGQAHR
jgi:hypothetical protein